MTVINYYSFGRRERGDFLCATDCHVVVFGQNHETLQLVYKDVAILHGIKPVMLWLNEYATEMITGVLKSLESKSEKAFRAARREIGLKD